MRQIDKIIIHCSATRPAMDIGVAEIRQWHIAKQWADVGYHYVIRRSGNIEPGRPERLIGAHVQGHNSDSIGICMVGGVDDKNRPEANFTRSQWSALEHLVKQLLVTYPGAEISGHRDWTDAKACPSFDAKAWWYA